MLPRRSSIVSRSPSQVPSIGSFIRCSLTTDLCITLAYLSALPQLTTATLAAIATGPQCPFTSATISPAAPDTITSDEEITGA